MQQKLFHSRNSLSVSQFKFPRVTYPMDHDPARFNSVTDKWVTILLGSVVRYNRQVCVVNFHIAAL